MPIRPIARCALLALPAVALRVTGTPLPPVLALLLFGTAVVAASFLLAWAAEAARMDISGPLAIAVLAVVAVLPEYAVDLYYAHTAGSDPAYLAYAAANMTGSNRLLLGLGWSSVVLVALWMSARRAGCPVRALVLDPGHRTELGFLAVAAVLAFTVPLTGQIHLSLGLVLIGLFGWYLWRASRAESTAPELVGPAARIGALPARVRRPLVIGMFVVAAVVVLAGAAPFADALVATGARLGVDEFLLVQWLAPLASESPEFIVAILFAVHGRGADAIGTLISSKINQWTLLVGSLPVAHLLGGGPAGLALDARQVEEFLLTATQTVLGVAALLALRFPRWLAVALLGLFAVQFALPGQTARYVLCGIYAALAVAALVHHRRHLGRTLTAPFRRTDREHRAPTVATVHRS